MQMEAPGPRQTDSRSRQPVLAQLPTNFACLFTPLVSLRQSLRNIEVVKFAQRLSAAHCRVVSSFLIMHGGRGVSLFVLFLPASENQLKVAV